MSLCVCVCGGGTECVMPSENLPFSKNPRMIEKVRRQSWEPGHGLVSRWSQPSVVLVVLFIAFPPCDLKSNVCSKILSQDSSAFQLDILLEVSGPLKEAEDFRGVLASLGRPQGMEVVHQRHIPWGCSRSH